MPLADVSYPKAALLGGFALLVGACLDWSSLQHGKCGDGFVGVEEACDDGNRISGDGCSDSCRIEPPECGNGRREAGEDCDDANLLDNDSCLSTCRAARCGDGKLWDFQEACDDGNDEPGDGCSPECTIEPQPTGPRCGDGMVDAGEACDDGNMSNVDACLNGCSFATCGDGYQRKGVEECDDGNVMSGDGCARACLDCSGPGTYFREGNSHCYVVHAELASAQEARTLCQQEGGDLWTVTSEAEGTDVANRLALSGRYWLGLQTTTNGNTWVSGEGTQFTHFAAGEPSDVALKCVAFDRAPESGTWSSAACKNELQFVCERAPAFLLADNHHAYRIHTGALDVGSARTQCAAEGGYLATLATEVERVLVGKNAKLQLWVDAGDAAQEGQYLWASGEPVDDGSFATGQPDDNDATQNCLYLNPNDRFADAACGDRRAYICEFD